MIPIDAIAHNTMEAIDAAITWAGYAALIGIMVLIATARRRM